MRDIVSRIYPDKLKDHMNQLLIYNGVEYEVNSFMGATTSIVLGISCILAILLSNICEVPFIAAFISVMVILLFGVYSYLVLRAEQRGRFAESVLPDVLSLMGSNLKSGLSIDRSLLLATRPEFGYLQDEIRYVGGRVVSGESFENALMEMSSRIKSRSLEATIDLIIQGIRSGGELADALDKIADVLRDREFVRKEIRAGVQMYISFIIFAILFGAPMLFGISSFLVEMLADMSSNLAVMQRGMAGESTPSSMSISTEFIKTFSIISLISTSIMGSIVVGLISSGNLNKGIKHIPVFCVVSVTLFLIINKTLVMTIGSMFS